MDNFRKIQIISLIGIFLAFVVVGVGAWTRLVDAGLGCPDWPGCYGYVWMPVTESEINQANVAFPEREFELAKAVPEVVHRYFAGTLGLLIFGLFFLAIFSKIKDRRLNNLIFAATVLVCIQSLFGYLTVSLQLWPQVVTLHLLGGFFTTTLVFLIFLRSSQLRSTFNISFPVLAQTKTLLNWAFPFLIGQIILGVWLSSNYAALACPDFPKCHGQWLPPADYTKGFNFLQQIGPDYLGGQLDVESRVAIHFIHRLGAIAVSVVFLLLTWRFYKENFRVASFGFAALIGFQLALGISNIYFQVPLYVAIAHNLGALFLLMYLSFIRLKSSTISTA